MVTPGRHIALYVHELAHTGVARNTLLLAEGLRARGHKVELVTALPGGPIVPKVGRTALLKAPLASRAAEHLSAVRPLRRYLKETTPDLAVSMGNHGHFTFWLASRGLAQPARIYRISNDLRRTAPGAPPPFLAKRLLRPLFTKRLIEDGRAIVLLADGLLPEKLDKAARSAGKRIAIPNGIDVARARSLAEAPCPHPWLESGSPVILAVGRLAPQKNFGTLITALARLPSSLDARLIIFGESRDESRAELLDHAQALGIADRVLLAGTTDNVYAWMRRATVVIQPSWWEGFSVVLLEAMAVGTPVIASRSAGAAPDIIGERYGLLVDPADADAMARAIVKQVDVHTRIMPAARASDYDLQRTLDGWDRLIRKLAPPQSPENRLSAAPRLSASIDFEYVS